MSNSGVFIGVRVEYNSRQKLVNFCQENGIDINLVTSFDRRMHTSLIYSPNLNDEMMEIKQAQFTVKPMEWKVFENKLSGMRALALGINSVGIQDYHNGLKRFGLNHRYDSYNPHISLAYDLPEDVCAPKNVPDFQIILEDIYIKEFHLTAPSKDISKQVLAVKNYSLEKYELKEKIDKMREEKMLAKKAKFKPI